MTTLTYKQCKELKDAGLFQRIGGGEGFWYSKRGERIDDDGQVIFNQCVYCPTLDELMEECRSLRRLEFENDGLWYAVSFSQNEVMGSSVGMGKTRIEAVYHLYLELKK